jgi:predicted transcriptional regulator
MTTLDLKAGVLTHHLNMLERQQYIKSLQDGANRRFYTKDMKIDTKLLLSPAQENILQAIKNNPGISQSDIASKLQMTKKTVYYNVKNLRDAGLVFIDTDGRDTECFYAGET